MRSGRLLSTSLLVVILLLAGAVHATLSVTTSRNDYVGNGATATYSYTFRITAASDLRVTKRTTAGVETTLVLTTDYTVTGVGVGSGGTITLTAGNLPSGYALTIRRVVPLTQPTDLRNQGPFLAETHETVFDRLTMQNQQQQEELTRSVRVSETNGPFNPLLPSTISQAGGLYLAVNTAGTAFDLIPQNAGGAFSSPAITGSVSGGADYLSPTLTTPILKSYTIASLPAAGTAGRLARVTDGLRCLWYDFGNFWKSYGGYADVRCFVTGGAGTSGSPWTSASNTGGFQEAIDGLPAGGGEVRAPEGYYAVSARVDSPQNVHIAGHGLSTVIQSTVASDHTFKLGQSSVGLNYGVSLERMQINLAGSSGHGILLFNTAGGTLSEIRFDSTGNNYTHTCVTIDGDGASSLFNRIESVYALHCHIGFHVKATAGGTYATQQTFIQSSAFGDWPTDTTSIGFLFDGEDGVDSVILGGNVEATSKGVHIVSADGITSTGQRFEANALDIELGANATQNTFIGCRNIGATGSGRTITIQGATRNSNNTFFGCSGGSGAAYNVIEHDTRFYAPSAAIVPVSIRGFASQSANLVEVSNNADAVRLSIAPDGLLTSQGGVTTTRLKAIGTALVTGDVSLSAGWGTTASVSATSGVDQRFRFTVTSAGTGQGASPTATLAFKDGTWTAAPFAVCSRNGGNQAAVLPTWTTTATTLVITFPGTPIAAETYTFECVGMG